MKFKVGDKVRIIRSEVDAEVFKEYIGKIFTIKDAALTTHGTGRYSLEGDDSYFWFDDELMLVHRGVCDMKKEFEKKDLKNGDVIKRRNGHVEIVCADTGTLICKDGWNYLGDIRPDLTDIAGDDYDIVAVRRPTCACDCQFDAFAGNRGRLVYERKEVEEMTLEEVCKALGKEIKIVKK